MIDLARWAIGVLTILSLVAVVGYLVGFGILVAWVLAFGSKRDPLEEELDAFLEQLLGRRDAKAGRVGALRRPAPEVPVPGIPRPASAGRQPPSPLALPSAGQGGHHKGWSAGAGQRSKGGRR